MSQLKAVVGQLFVIAHHELLLVLLGALLLASAGTTDHLSMSLSFLLTVEDTSDMCCYELLQTRECGWVEPWKNNFFVCPSRQS